MNMWGSDTDEVDRPTSVVLISFKTQQKCEPVRAFLVVMRLNKKFTDGRKGESDVLLPHIFISAHLTDV